MKIVQLTSEEFKIWRDEISKLIEIAICAGFPNNYIPKHYYNDKCDALKNYLEKGSAIVFLAMEDELAGMAWCHEIHRFDERRLHIAHIAVYPKWENLGIGTCLVSAIEQYAAERKYTGIDLMVSAFDEKATHFYERNGFKNERCLMKKDL